MKINKKLVKSGMLTTLITLSAPVSAMDKPQTMEDMWKIIQAQQKQIDEMKASMKAVPEKAATSNVQNQENKIAASNVQNSENKAEASNVKNLERKTDILSQEVEKLRTNLAIPEETKYKSMYGLGPAASKVYQVGKGLSLGGYGEANYQKIVSDQGERKR